MIKIFLLVLLLTFTLPLRLSLALPPLGYVEFIHVEAWVDGIDDFEMVGNQWRWQHWLYHLPETHNVTRPTIVNYQSFLSEWAPNVDQNRPQMGIYSYYNTVVGLQSLQEFFGSDVVIYFESIYARDSIELVQSPNIFNNYTFTVRLNDEPGSAMGRYEFKIWGYGSNLIPTPAPVPEPSTIFLLGFGFLNLVFFRRKK